MKVLNITKQILWSAIGLMLAFNTEFPIAQAYEGVRPNDCLVLDTYDGDSGRQSITLRTALNVAGRTNRADQRCRESITVQSGEININRPLVIAINVVSDGADDFKYQILGMKDGTEGARVKINASNLASYTGQERKCAIIFRRTHQIELKNFILENVPEGFDGVCLEGSADFITVDNVEVAHVFGGNGIVIDSDSRENLITAKSKLTNIDGGSGIYIKEPDLASHIKLVGTTRNPTGTNTDGTAIFSGNGGSDFVMRAIDPGFGLIQSDADVKILFSEVNTTGETGEFLIRGAAVRKSVECLPFIPESGGSELLNQLVSELNRIQVYATGLRTSGNSAGRKAAFLTYVTKRSECEDPATCANGILDGSNPISSAGDFGGIFSFVLDTNALLTRLNQNLEGEDRFQTIEELVLVPELSGDTVASSSKIISLIGGNQNADSCEGQADSGGGTLDEAGFIYSNIGWKTRQQCEAATAHPVSDVWDSDGDGIPDYKEDLDDDCNCDAWEFSCWDKPDSDGDGISDRDETLGGTINPTRTQATVADTLFCNVGRIPGVPATVSEADATVDDLCDTDGDGVSNAQDDNSDDDNCELNDYEEDRARIFNSASPAHFYVWGGVGGRVAFRDDQGDHVECTDFLNDNGNPEAGAYYGIFRVKKDLSGVPVQHFFATAVGADEGLMPLICLNDSVRSPNNFDGVFQSANGETSSYLKDTNGDDLDDCQCRGGDKNLEFGTDGSVEGQCLLSCVNYEIFRGLPEQYVNNAANPTALKLDEEGIPLLYKQPCDVIERLCSDIDQDGIRDCVETQIGECNSIDAGRNLNPYRKDTDGDGQVDGPAAIGSGVEPDDCPFASCTDPRAVYAHRPALACFLDRDQDQLRDAEEDLNKNGIVETVGGLDGRATTETDPLSDDTDSDKIKDFIEVQTWNRYTNPAHHDTDEDGLPDGLEVVDHTGASPNRPYSDESGLGCGRFELVDPVANLTTLLTRSDNNSRRIGTDPARADTDSDGIPDGVEVKCEVQSTENEDFAGGFTELDICSNPLADDSDGDGINDNLEYALSSGNDTVGMAPDGAMQYFESSPCDRDTDRDGQPDSTDACPTSTNQQCTSVGADGPDSDGDGLSDGKEAALGTDPNLPDSDFDDIPDGQEDVDHDGIVEISQGETDPNLADTDADGLEDGEELRLGTYANVLDTDQDCIPDGVEVNFNPFSGFTGTDTDPRTPDTDGDGLCDGNNSSSSGGLAGDVTCIRGEDLNCNGKVDPSATNPNLLGETDPRIADTDNDGIDDRTEVCSGGTCNIAANIGHATLGAPSGCFSLAPVAPFEPSSMLYVYGLLLMLNRVVRRKLSLRAEAKQSPKDPKGDCFGLSASQ